MRDANQPIRILPMSSDEFEGWTPERVQSQFFLEELPSREAGRYDYRTAGMDAPSGTTVLFQYANKIIASAVFDGSERFPQPAGPYHGALYFDIYSIRVFDPVGSETMRDVWPENFTGFGRVKSQLSASCYPLFERRLTGVRAPLAPVAEIHDIEPPKPDRVLATSSRVIRDTELSRHVKALHQYRCQLLHCQHTIVLADGSRYAEAHHIKPLGTPHEGPDISENIVCLCPNHHAACDLGAMPLKTEELRQVCGHSVDARYLNYHNEEICGQKRA